MAKKKETRGRKPKGYTKRLTLNLPPDIVERFDGVKASWAETHPFQPDPTDTTIWHEALRRGLAAIVMSRQSNNAVAEFDYTPPTAPQNSSFAVEGDTLEIIKELHARGHSENAIARALREKGVPTARGGEWAAATVRGILRRVNPSSRTRQEIARAQSAASAARIEYPYSEYRRAEVYELIQQLHGGGMKSSEIAIALTEARVPTARGARAWHTTVVTDILRRTGKKPPTRRGGY